MNSKRELRDWPSAVLGEINCTNIIEKIHSHHAPNKLTVRVATVYNTKQLLPRLFFKKNRTNINQ